MLPFMGKWKGTGEIGNMDYLQTGTGGWGTDTLVPFEL